MTMLGAPCHAAIVDLTRNEGTMGTRQGSLVQRRQDPLRARYSIATAEARIVDAAQTISACGWDAFHGVVVPNNGVDAPLQFGIHRTVGGFHDHPNPGDLLS